MSGAPITRRFDPLAQAATLVLRAEELVERALREGARSAEAFGTTTESVRIRYGKGDLELAQVDQRTELGLTAIVGQRGGFASTNQTDEHSLVETARAATALARLSLADPCTDLVEPGETPEALRLLHPDLAALPIEACSELARDLVTRTLGIDPRLSLDRAALEVTRRSIAVHSSRGVHATASDAELSGTLFGMAVDGADVGGFESGSETVRDPSQWPELGGRLVRRFAEVALGNLGATRAESYRGPVLFTPQAFLAVFVRPMVAAASALAVQRGRSALAGKLGSQVAAATLTIRDDPRDPELSGARAFDREGTPTRTLDIVRRGVLESHLYNGYAARVESRRSTGHATGFARSSPGLGPHALCVRGGRGTVQDLCSRMGRGLLVQRFSGSVDPASGDFSGVAKSARWIERGSHARSVRETLISGNAFALLCGEVALSSPPERVMGAELAPWALVDGVSVTAG